jgi:MFS transporter, ACS family, tartrate transporter
MNVHPQQVMGKVARHLVPFLIFCYFLAYLDRVNIGFAALTMNKDLGLSASAFGFAASIFFIGYFVFEVPSNLLLEKYGARIWIARIMISWGILSTAMAFVWNDTSFCVLRFIFGIAEAGFFPGIILYLTYWFPAEMRARMVGAFMVAVPGSAVIGSPLSTWILDAFVSEPLGLKGWQWLFIIQGLPTIITGILVLKWLTDSPEKAAWLTPEERTWLANRMAAERATKEAVHHFTVKEALTHPRILALSVVYFGAVIGLYGLSLWLPTIIKNFGVSIMQTGILGSLPALAGAIGMVLWTRHSDATSERKWHMVIPCVIGAIGLIMAGIVESPTTSFLLLIVAGLGIYTSLPSFWPLPTAMLTGSAAAGGIALVNSIGNLGGFVGPYVVGLVKDLTGGFAGGLYLLAAFLLLAAVIVIVLGHDLRLEQIPPDVEPATAP